MRVTFKYRKLAVLARRVHGAQLAYRHFDKLDTLRPSFHVSPMLSTDEARRIIAESLHLLPAERAGLREAQGRHLRASLVAEEDMPPFDRSAFDGYAISARPERARLRLVETVAAGHMPQATLGPDECARIFTGAPLPPGADAVAMQEACAVDGVTVEVPALRAGEGVRRRGEDARAGAVLVAAGARLGPVELSLLAQLGQVHPLVAPRPRIFHVRTGDEIVPPETDPGPGQIRDSNSTLIAALIAEAGGEVIGHATAADRLDALVEACGQGGDADLLLISGGASVGDYDFGKTALAELGFSVRFAGLNLRPGKPLIFATRGRQAAFVIPGNPLSHFVCWHVVIRAALDVWISGVAGLLLVEMELGGRVPGNARETWWPAQIGHIAGRAVAKPLQWKSSGDMTGIAGARGLIQVPAGSEGLGPGHAVAVLQI
jgi:molybdopterin molybdotransferase